MIAVSSLFSMAYFTNEGLDVERCTDDTVYKDFTGEIVLREICIFPFTGKTITDTFLGCDEGFKQINETCLQIKQDPEPEPTSIDHQNLIDARNKLREIYDIDSSLGPFNIKDVIVGHGMGDGFLIVDILKEYYDSAEDRELIIQKIVDITGGNVDIEFNSSGAIAPTNIEFVFPYVWNSFLNRNGIEFTPKEQSYANADIGYERQNRVCSPIVASNGTEFYISSIFTYEPFEITGTFIDKIKPDDCYKVWKTDTVLVEPDRILMLWLENYHEENEN